MSSPIIFLDIDGVMSVELARPAPDGSGKYVFSDFSPEAIRALTSVCTATDARVVIMSSWKRNHGLAEICQPFFALGFPGDRIIDVTPTLDGKTWRVRGHEVQYWVYRNWPVNRFVLVDDGPWHSGIPDLEKRHVLVDNKTGLTCNYINKITDILDNDCWGCWDV